MVSIEGTELRQWLDSDKADPILLIGYHLDDGENEWQIDAVTDHGFTLTLLEVDGRTPTTTRKQLLTSAIKEAFSFWSEADDSALRERIFESRTPLQLKAAEAYRFLLQRKWPAGRPLGMSAIDAANILMQLDGTGIPPRPADIDKLAGIAEQSPETALVGAHWIDDFLKGNPSAAQSLGGHCRIHLSSLFRTAGRYDDALKATSVLVTGQTAGLDQSTIAAMCVTRSAALMDKFEHARAVDTANKFLAEARKLLNRSYAIHGGNSNDYHSATFGRLLSLERTLDAE